MPEFYIINVRKIFFPEYQNTRIFIIFFRKINKIREFYMIFAGKMPEFYIINVRKIFSPNFRGGGTCPPAPRLLHLWTCARNTRRTTHVVFSPFLHSVSLRSQTFAGMRSRLDSAAHSKTPYVHRLISYMFRLLA